MRTGILKLLHNSYISYISFVILIDPPVFIKHLETMSVKVGENVKLECQIMNSLIVEWFYDDMQITIAEGTEMFYDRDTGITSLTIENICPEDSGDYTVRAINDAGISSNSSRLTVQGKN